MKIGVVGNGMIVGMFLHDAALVDGADIVSLCVRPGSLEKGQKISEEYHIPKIETDYERYGITLEKGEEKRLSYSKDGYISRGYLNYYNERGELVKTKMIRENKYNATKGIVLKREN